VKNMDTNVIRWKENDESSNAKKNMTSCILEDVASVFRVTVMGLQNVGSRFHQNADNALPGCTTS